jgi:hypothetical protein
MEEGFCEVKFRTCAAKDSISFGMLRVWGKDIKLVSQGVNP